MLKAERVPLGPALGSPVWHGVSGSPRELNCVERSLQRAPASAPHSQPGTEEQTQPQIDVPHTRMHISL